MNINFLNAASGTNGNDKTQTDPAKDANDMFMTLLMAQLKSQSPLDPMDPNQFVGQLVQFNSLDQLIQIRQTLQQLTEVPAASSK